MGKDKEIGWLYDEIPSLIEKGILTEESAVKLREHYGEPERNNSRNLVFIISAILGSILIGLGIILLFAHNWDEYSRTTRTVLSFIPLLVAEFLFGYAYFRQRNSISWMESTAGFLVLMVGSSLFLIGQIYNLGGNLSELLFTWIVLTIPLIYFSRTVLPYVFYMILLTWWSFIADETVNKWHLAHQLPVAKLAFLFLALAMIPHLVRNIDRTRFTGRGNIIGWFYAASLIISASPILLDGGGLAMLFYDACMVTLLYALGKIFYDNVKQFWQKPFQVTAIASIFILSLYGTFDSFWRELTVGSWLFGTEKVMHESRLVLYIIGCMFFGGAAYIMYNRFKQEKPVNYFPLCFPVLIGIGILMLKYYPENDITITIFNLFVLGYSVYYIYSGIKLDRTSLVNAGMLFLSLLIIVRFFSDNIAFLVKGTIFILIGIGFLLVNYFLMKKRQKNA